MIDDPRTYKKLTATEHSKDFRTAVQIQEVAMPIPGQGEILVKNLYAGVNAADTMMAAGQYLLPTPLPCDMGVEALGEVVEVGPGVDDITVGDAVVVNGIGTGYCEYHVTKARYAIPVAQATPEVMSLSIGGLTASLGLLETGAMTSGETVLVTAAAGGTGQFAVQLAKLAGNHVIGTCGSESKAALLHDLGCDRVVNYKKEPLRKVLKDEYPNGIDLAFEGVGRHLFDAALDYLARFGRLVTIGFVAEYKDQPDFQQRVRTYYKLIAKNASIRGFNLNLWYGRPELRTHMTRLVQQLGEGMLRPHIDPTVFRGVDQAADAVEYLQSGQNSGKVIVRFT